MAGLESRTVTVAGARMRIWEQGAGEPVGFLPGVGGCPRWREALDILSRSRRVIVPSLPGFQGGDPLHLELDDNSDWLCAVLDLIEAAGLAGTDMVGESMGGALLADVAAHAPGIARRLVLCGSYGLYDEAEPVADVFAQITSVQESLLAADSDAFARAFACDDSDDPAQWEIIRYRAMVAAARYLWPFGDRGLAKRLHRIGQPVLLLWGERDAVVPPSYAQRFAKAIAGDTRVRTVPDAGHLVSVDAPRAFAEAVLEFLSDK